MDDTLPHQFDASFLGMTFINPIRLVPITFGQVPKEHWSEGQYTDTSVGIA